MATAAYNINAIDVDGIQMHNRIGKEGNRTRMA